ncbi:MAG: efflux RND transporter periplasmic adaptor subunit [Bacteroidales bacterium]|nr:efflux RND transporter periplasmic adaptor subunit [Bacteroidales bacterium]
MGKKILTIGISLLVIITAVIFTISMINNKATARINKSKQDNINVQSDIVENVVLTTVVEYSGRISSFENISVSAEVSGKIMQGSVHFKEGQYFKQGDLLLHIYNEDAEAGLKSLKSNYLRTLSTILPDLSIDYPDNYNTWLSFFNAIDINSKLPELPAINDDQLKVYLASNGVISEYYSLYQQEIKLTKYDIYAPFNGYFKTVNKEVGAIASIGAELAVIIRSDKLEVTVPVLVNDIKRIKAGNEVDIISGDDKYTGTVSRIAGFVDESTQSVNVYVNIDNSGAGKLLEGEFVDVVFENENQVEGIKIPREALVENNSVYLVKSGVLKLTEINVVQILDDYTVISGVPTGDTIVVESLISVKDGQSVGVIL